MKKLRGVWRRYMLRPFVYTAFTRLVLGLFAVLLSDYLFSGPAGQNAGPVSLRRTCA